VRGYPILVGFFSDRARGRIEAQGNWVTERSVAAGR